MKNNISKEKKEKMKEYKKKKKYSKKEASIIEIPIEFT